MSKQPTLFNARPSDLGERYEIRPHFTEPQDVPRLAGQNGRLLERLRIGPVTNTEIVEKMKIWAAATRISNVREWLRKHTGETIICQRLEGGVFRYTIEKEK